MRVFHCNNHINFVDENNVYVEFSGNDNNWLITNTFFKAWFVTNWDGFVFNLYYCYKFDGPYGKEVEFHLTNKENYNIILNLNGPGKYKFYNVIETITQGEI